MIKRLTECDIAVRIVPTHLRWPEAATSIAWARLHECVQQLHEFARIVDNDCTEAQQTTGLSRDEIERARIEIGHEALKKLANFRSFNIAEQAARKEIDILEKREGLGADEARAKRELVKARDELRAGIAATERLLLDICKERVGSARCQVYY
jgi:hypothetical protein